MAFVHISSAPNRDLYEAVRRSVDLSALQADGLLLHAASHLPTGEIRIVDIYQSAEAMQRANTRMRAAFAGTGVDAVLESRPEPETSETFELVR